MFKIEATTSPLELKKTHDLFCESINGKSTKEGYEYYKKNKSKYFYNTLETKTKYESINYRRCSFCSKYICEFNSEMTIEHIELKSENPHKIFLWENLLCSCRTCNTKRSTNEHIQELYLDPRNTKNIEEYFLYNSDGTIEPNRNLSEEEFKKAEYMIKLYKLNRDALVYERKDFYLDMLDENFNSFLKNKIIETSEHVIFLSLYNQIKEVY